MKSYLDAALEGKNDWWRYLGEFDMTFNLITLFVGLASFYLLAFKVWPKKRPAPTEP